MLIASTVNEHSMTKRRGLFLPLFFYSFTIVTIVVLYISGSMTNAHMGREVRLPVALLFEKFVQLYK
jgi:hypothetical protein